MGEVLSESYRSEVFGRCNYLVIQPKVIIVTLSIISALLKFLEIRIEGSPRIRIRLRKELSVTLSGTCFALAALV